MAYPSDIDDWNMGRALLLSGDSEQFNHYLGASNTTQPPVSAVGQTPVLSTGWPHDNHSLSHTSASPDLSWPPHTPQFASTAGNSPLLPNPSVNHASAFLNPGWNTQTQPSASLLDPSTSHPSMSLGPNYTVHTATGHPVVENLSRSNMQSSSTLRPGQTTIRNPNIQVAHVEATSVHSEGQGRASDGRWECRWKGCTSHTTFSARSSLMRHVRVQHVDHRSVECPECGQTFGRVDNMREHRGRRHRVWNDATGVGLD